MSKSGSKKVVFIFSLRTQRLPEIEFAGAELDIRDECGETQVIRSSFARGAFA